MIHYRWARLVLGIGLLLVSDALLAVQQPPNGKGDKQVIPPEGGGSAAAAVLGNWVDLLEPPSTTPDDKGMGKDVPPPKPPLIKRLSEVLMTDRKKSSQDLVRKMAIKVIQDMGEDGKEAIPAMLALAHSDPSPAIQAQARAVVKTYSAADMARQLSRVLREPEADRELRLIACLMLPRIYRGPTLETSLKDEVRKAMAEGLVDQDPDVQIAAARALEECERKTPLKRQTVQLEFDLTKLKLARLSVDDVVKAIQKENPGLEAEKVDAQTMKCKVRDLDDAMFLDRFVLPTTVVKMRLKAVATPKAAPEPAPEEEKKETPAARKVILEFDAELLMAAKLTVADVLKALQTAKAKLDARQVGETIECTLAGAEDRKFLEGFLLPGTTLKLRLPDVAQIKDAPPAKKDEGSK